MAIYTLLKKQDKYLLTNDDAVPFDYSVEKLQNCLNYVELNSDSISVGQTVEISFDGDGDYNVIVDGETVAVNHFPALEESIIEDMKLFVCDCDCSCEMSDSCGLLMLRAKIDVYKRLTNPEGLVYYDAVNEETKCLVKKPVYCALDTQTLLGKLTCNEKLVKQLISLDYLGMYFAATKPLTEQEDIDYSNTKYQIDKIFCCIQSLGIDIEKIESVVDAV